ncbi:septal ring lytic transglycosylase RlpA family protein [Daejeonella lutea]|uniref:LysM domain-containing protein n=1 Tax=Daejeonella lutea TaxID=572036 RepID=A0A1T5AG34_9SPHI|nr:LysM peptidoglycan-binding domain-containing protein [Daejeonella lutea]SKB33707.1 LysM domain-containing protein [Daejeonella lutea]
MLIRLVLSLCFIFLVGKVNASITLDSISVENLNGKKTIVHKVEAKETYYSIGRKYNVTPQSIIQFNSNRTLQIGTILRVPTDRSYSAPQAQATYEKPEATAPSKLAVIDYKVGPREYLVAIARKFNTTVEDIKALNNLTSNNLAIGQIIKVPYGNTSAVVPPQAPPLDIPKAEPRNSSTQIDSSMNAGDRLKLPPARYGLREVDERGVAIWISDENLDGTKMLALHQTAPIGTIIKITNPMTGKSTFTKVVGKFSQNESTKDAIIVITKAAADLIGAIDKRFQATIVYGVPNE